MKTERLETCYCCEALASSREHVPPKALYPEQKDSPGGVNFREKLITVPSCDVHNTQKSCDDEFLMYILTMTDGVNAVGELQIPKLMRSLRRRPALMQRMMEGATPALVKDRTTGRLGESVGFRVDLERVDQAMSLIAKGVYFFHRGSKLVGSPEHVMIQFAQADGSFSQRKWREACDAVNLHFDGLERLGTLPDVFYAQIFELQGGVFLRLVFYGALTAIVAFPAEAIVPSISP